MRRRLPVRLKLAVVTAALTFGILCIFAVAIGAVAEQRIRAGFDDDLRATAADLEDDLQPRVEDGEVKIRTDPLIGAEVGGAQVRVLVGRRVVYPSGLGWLAEPGTEGL